MADWVSENKQDHCLTSDCSRMRPELWVFTPQLLSLFLCVCVCVCVFVMERMERAVFVCVFCLCVLPFDWAVSVNAVSARIFWSGCAWLVLLYRMTFDMFSSQGLVAYPAGPASNPHSHTLTWTWRACTHAHTHTHTHPHPPNSTFPDVGIRLWRVVGCNTI